MPEHKPGSPEAIKAALAAAEAAAAEAAGKDKEGADEEVTLTKAEHDALQAKLRILEKGERERRAAEKAAEKATTEKAAKKRLEAAEAAGMGMELKEAQSAASAAAAELQEIRTERAIERSLKKRDWNEEAKELALAQVNAQGFEGLDSDERGIPTAESIEKMLDQLAEAYPMTFTAPARRPGDKKPASEKKPAGARTPSTPTLVDESGDPKFEGYISPEDFLKVSQVERQTPEYLKRLQKSMKLWPQHFNHRLLDQQD